MKKFLLFVCLWPCISFAGERSGHFLKIFGRVSPKTTQLRSASSTPLARPLRDSMYTYQGEENVLTSIEYYTYDALGRPARVETQSVRAADGRLVPSSRTEYSFLEDQKGELYEWTETTYVYDREQWQQASFVVNGYDAATDLQIYMKSFLYENNELVKDWTWEAVEFTPEGYPSLVMDSMFHHDGSVDVMRMDATYDGFNRPVRGTTYGQVPETGEWFPVQRDQLAYDDEGKILRQYAESMEDGRWVFSFVYTYQYDERGNMTHETDREADGSVYRIRYQNFYSDRVVTHNETLRANPSYTVRMIPSSRILQVDLGEAAEGQITLVNAAGSIVYRQTLHSAVSSIPLGALSTGFYIIHIYTPEGEASHQVIIR